ncbi:MAG: DUF3341 domain-containing protein [Planctomycetota bacterium]|nr:DUF3341 domain-containing protein [Planctomycetota bacterium]NCF99739.1 DUF3341 domain-containing protein [Planctomycetia bacterium]MDC0852934.1 DUF3341 domain-containing protein [Planctomycetota bacterium]MDG1455468.1 DUF3341 domain-containing protein [Planctomycetota bacterium]MDG2084553.1 DUF3341 domain-containing protein [Planctomycetota bacterium]
MSEPKTHEPAFDTITAEGSVDPKPVVLIAEFETADQLMSAAEKVRDEGFKRWDCHTPYPVHGLDGAMGIRPTILPWIVLGGGFTGFCGGLLMQGWMNGISYPFLISGKPFFSIPASIPVAFELTILLSAFGAFGGMLALNGLPRMFNPLFRSDRFRRATADRFFISIEARDRRFDADSNARFLRGIGANAIEVIEE